MYSRWMNLAVLALWLASMSWLLTQKVLPPMFVGDPPSYETILDVPEDHPPTGWNLAINGQPLGWAVTDVQRSDSGVTEIQNHVHFDRLPLNELVPAWLRSLLKLDDAPLLNLPMDTRNTLTVDALGRLVRVDSAVQFESLPETIRLQGTVEGSQLLLRVSSGGFSHKASTFLPPDALPGDALSPQARLPGLRAGQSWTVPCYNPLRPDNPLEVLQATVEAREPILWQGQTEQVWLVVYRSDAGAALGTQKKPRGRLWVRGDGAVLRQEVIIFDASIVFLRMTDNESQDLWHDRIPRGDAEI